MAESSLYAGERDGARVFQLGRIGFDQSSDDLDSIVYTGTYRTERIFPAGVGALVNFRRIAIHLLITGSYIFTVRIWVDNERTTLGTGGEQTITISDDGGGLREVTEEIEIEAEGSHIQVEITIDSDDITGTFLIEGISARGRVTRSSATRTGEAT